MVTMSALHNLYPGNIVDEPAKALQAILRAIIVRTNFVPAVRHRLGWRGLKNCSNEEEAWTAKIANWPGVFGIIWVAPDITRQRLTGHFQLNYFPDPDEELAESFSLQGVAWTQRQDYLACVRRFPFYSDLCDLFYVGDLALTLDLPDMDFSLEMAASTRLATMAMDGVEVLSRGEPLTLVPPGGLDQDLPSFRIARAMFEVLAASTAFCLEVPPTYFRHQRMPGTLTRYWSDGRQEQHAGDHSWMHHCRLAFSAIPKSDQRCAPAAGDQNTIAWRSGDPLPATWQSAPWWQAHQMGHYKSLDKQLLGIDDRPALIVVTGFLGSGKTTFLQHFVAYQVQRDRFVAVIQNEVGPVGLDGRLLGSDNLVVTEIDEGCVCCTLTGQLKPALHRLCNDFQPDFIVLETTGLANPLNFMDELNSLSDMVRIDSVTTVVDGPFCRSSRAVSRVVAPQIQSADLLLLNKTDHMSARALEKAKAYLRQLNPTAPIIPTIRGDINPGLFYSLDPREGHRAAASAGNARARDHASHQQDRIQSCKLVFNAPLNRRRFVQTLEKAMPASIFRVKGIIAFSDRPEPMLLQYVAGRFEISVFADHWEQEGFLIFIGHDLAPGSLEALFNQCLA